VDRLDLLTFRIATINKPHMGKGAWTDYISGYPEFRNSLGGHCIVKFFSHTFPLDYLKKWFTLVCTPEWLLLTIPA
jgi:hypothetical protein